MRAGFVLVGGRSTRMGRDKALLPYAEGTLLETVASRVLAACGSVALIGNPERYAHLGYPVYADLIPGHGPISGLHTVLSLGLADWNLLVACDMPHVEATVLDSLLARAEALAEPRMACVVPVTPEGRLQPLCAAYHSSCLSLVQEALAAGLSRMTELAAKLSCFPFPQAEAFSFTNVNTLEEWAGLQPGIPL